MVQCLGRSFRDRPGELTLTLTLTLALALALALAQALAPAPALTHPILEELPRG
jgi:hypothetical protein